WLEFTTDRPSRGPLDPELVVTWLATLPLASQKLGRAALKRAYGARALDWELIELRRYRRNEPKLRASLLSTEERAQLRAAYRHDPRLRAMFELFWVLRRAEVAALSWPDVDLVRGVVAIHHGKGDKSAVQALPVETRAALAAWHQAAGAPTTGPVFPSE